MAAPSPYATWIRRVGGSLVDGLVIGVPTTVLMIAGFAWGFAGMDWVCTNNSAGNATNCVTTPGSHFNAGGGVLIALAVMVLIGWVVYVVIAVGGPRGATIGMRAVKIRCVTDGQFGQLGNGKSFGRYAIAAVFRFISFVGVIDRLFPLWDDKRQTLHDKVVSTVVLYEPDGR